MTIIFKGKIKTPDKDITNPYVEHYKGYHKLTYITTQRHLYIGL